MNAKYWRPHPSSNFYHTLIAIVKNTEEHLTFVSSTDSYKSLPVTLAMERIASIMAAAAALPMAIRPGPKEATASPALSAMAPIWAPIAETASLHVAQMSFLKKITTADNTPAIAAMARVTRMWIAATPPMVMLWIIANKLPAATFPIRACIAAAKDPNEVFHSVHGKRSVFTLRVGVDE